MTIPKKLLVEGLDRLGKDTLIHGFLNECGHYQVIHFAKPPHLSFYERRDPSTSLKRYQEDSFRNLFQLLRASDARIICNRAHLGECVYAPLYRGYSGDYVFNIEQIFEAHTLRDTRLVLLTEDIQRSRHFVDDGRSLGDASKRSDEQGRFLRALDRSLIQDKRNICVTDTQTGEFRPVTAILAEALA